MSLPQVVLKRGRDMPLKGGHPWVFSGAIDKDVDRNLHLKPGSLVDVFSADGAFLGTGTWHGRNSIRVRMVSREHLDGFTQSFFTYRFRKLLHLKKQLLGPDTTGFRLVHSDADGFPGLIVDVFGSIVVFQLGADGFEEASSLITQALVEVLSPKCVVKRSDDPSRAPEVTFGENIDKAIFFENGLKILPLRKGHFKSMVRRLGKDIQDADITAALACGYPDTVPEILHSHCTGAGAGYKDVASVELLKALPIKTHICFPCLFHSIVALGKSRRVAHYDIVGAGTHHLKVFEYILVHSPHIALFLGNLVEPHHLLKEGEGPVRDIHPGHLHSAA